MHSKIYIWSQPDEKIQILPTIAYCGSLNYTMNAFYKRRETVSRCNPLSAYWYYKNLLPDTIDCFDPIAKDKLRKVVNNSPDAVEEPDNSEKIILCMMQCNLLLHLMSHCFVRMAVILAMVQVLTGELERTEQSEIVIKLIFHTIIKIKLKVFPDRVNPDDENCPMFKVITRILVLFICEWLSKIIKLFIVLKVIRF